MKSILDSPSVNMTSPASVRGAIRPGEFRREAGDWEFERLVPVPPGIRFIVRGCLTFSRGAHIGIRVLIEGRDTATTRRPVNLGSPLGDLRRESGTPPMVSQQLTLATDLIRWIRFDVAGWFTGQSSQHSGYRSRTVHDV